MAYFLAKDDLINALIIIQFRVTKLSHKAVGKKLFSAIFIVYSFSKLQNHFLFSVFNKFGMNRLKSLNNVKKGTQWLCQKLDAVANP